MLLIHKIKATRDFRGDKKLSVDDVTKRDDAAIAMNVKKQPMNSNDFIGDDNDDNNEDDDDDSVDDKHQVREIF